MQGQTHGCADLLPARSGDSPLGRISVRTIRSARDGPDLSERTLRRTGANMLISSRTLASLAATMTMVVMTVVLAMWSAPGRPAPADATPPAPAAEQDHPPRTH